MILYSTTNMHQDLNQIAKAVFKILRYVQFWAGWSCGIIRGGTGGGIWYAIV